MALPATTRTIAANMIRPDHQMSGVCSGRRSPGTIRLSLSALAESGQAHLSWSRRRFRRRASLAWQPQSSSSGAPELWPWARRHGRRRGHWNTTARMGSCSRRRCWLAAHTCHSFDLVCCGALATGAAGACGFAKGIAGMVGMVAPLVEISTSKGRDMML